MFESFEACARREILEETNLGLKNDVEFVSVENNFFMNSVPPQHYVDITLCAHADNECELENRETDKCEEWKWVSAEDLMDDTGPYRPLSVPLPNMFAVLSRHVCLVEF